MQFYFSRPNILTGSISDETKQQVVPSFPLIFSHYDSNLSHNVLICFTGRFTPYKLLQCHAFMLYRQLDIAMEALGTNLELRLFSPGSWRLTRSDTFGVKCAVCGVQTEHTVEPLPPDRTATLLMTGALNKDAKSGAKSLTSLDKNSRTSVKARQHQMEKKIRCRAHNYFSWLTFLRVSRTNLRLPFYSGGTKFEFRSQQSS